jgi:hypothetical protein
LRGGRHHADAGSAEDAGVDASNDAATDAAAAETGNLDAATDSGSGASDGGSGDGASRVHSVTLAWTASVTPGVTYDAYRSQGCTGTYTLLASGLTLTTWRDPAVTSGQTYCYVTTALNANGESLHSNSAQVVVP